MSKHIIICSDGTGNTAVKGRGTNVFKLFEAIDLNGHRSDPTLTVQIGIYDDGVGTEQFKPLKIFAGATGFGLARNVRHLYKALVRVYDEGDRIFLFGFSRGAFTVRTLAGMIVNCGILANDRLPTTGALDSAVRQAYRVYRQRYRTKLARSLGLGADQALIKKFEDRYKRYRGVRIGFIGVWDTVDAVGLPFSINEFVNVTIHQFKFPDPKLNSAVEYACQALSIDDQRRTFAPVLWADDPRIEQVWFAGAHSNVGGGYPKQGMSLVTLDWMLQKAHDRSGLRLLTSDRLFCREHANVDDKLYDPRAGLGIFYRWLPRDMVKLCEKAGAKPVVHLTVMERIARRTEDYAPGNLAPDALVDFTPSGDPATDAVVRKRAQAAQDVLHLAHAHKGGLSLLASTKPEIRIGRASYYVYLLACLAGLASALAFFFAPRMVFVRSIALTVVASLVAYFLALFVDRRMTAAFSKFWHVEQPKLRIALKNAREMAAAAASGKIL
jgi:hypothetical protein